MRRSFGGKCGTLLVLAVAWGAAKRRQAGIRAAWSCGTSRGSDPATGGGRQQGVVPRHLL